MPVNQVFQMALEFKLIHGDLQPDAGSWPGRPSDALLCRAAAVCQNLKLSAQSVCAPVIGFPPAPLRYPEGVSGRLLLNPTAGV
jgi:hypothetical protein